MTTHEAVAIIAQLDLVPKRSTFHAHNPRIDDRGRGIVEITTDASAVTIGAWFSQVGAMMVRHEQVPGQSWAVCWFDWR